VVRLVRYGRGLLHARERNRFRACCREIAARVPAPAFVMVGANDGVTGDPASDIFLAPPWRGLLIEPLPHCCERLRANFADRSRFTVVQVAVGPEVGRAPFYYVDPVGVRRLPEVRISFDQLGSFDRDHIATHLGGILAPFIRECEVEVRPLSQLIARAGMRDVHVLQIDVEGYEYSVLKTLDFAAHAPVLIFVEHKHLSDGDRRALEQLLHDRGYTVRNCGGDYCAVDNAALARLQR
jgi:FkbM family methyltransferase